jgi:hypothetical protein
MSGRVVPHPLTEALRSDRKSVFLTVVPLLLAGFIIAGPFFTFGMTVGAGGLVGVSLERLLTALLTTALVSVLSLIETYIEIYRNRVIVW